MTQGTDEHPLVGQTIAAKYKIVRLLGEGGMGCVYMGEQQLGTTTRKVAVKTLHKHLSHDKSIIARFQREVGTVAALEHPNTIQVFDFGTMEDGTLYIVMEYVQGRSVADILEKDGAMPPERVEKIMSQVVGSLEEAHGHGIVHRDLKPDNVVLCERAGQKDWVEVLDFGIAKRSSEHDPNEAKLTQQGMVLGTPPYMSPEQFTGQPVDVRSDIYALGVMAYEMLTGRLPWEANTAWEWASKHMTEQPYPLERQPLGPNVPERQRNAITRALAKDKNERFNNVREFFEAFATGAGMPSGASFAPNQPSAVPAGGGTAMMGASAASGPQSSNAPARAKTEMGAPVAMDFGNPGASGGPAPPPPMAAPPPAIAVPAGPMHTGGGSEKKGPPVLIIALGALAVLLIGGGAIAHFAMKPKPTTTTSLQLPSATAAPSASISAGAEEPPPVVASAAPLDSSGMKIPPQPNNGGGGGTPKTTPSAKPVPTPVPTPTPKGPEPAACQKARDAKKAGKGAAVVQAFESSCRSQGGTP